MKKPILALVALAILSAVSLWYLQWRSASDVQAPAVGQTPELAPQQPSDPAVAAPSEEVSWSIVQVSEGDGVSPPRSRVSVVTGGRTQALGEYEGSCFDIAGSAWSPVEGEISGVICWWAGGGTELGIFRENGKLVVKRGSLEEGSEEYPGFRGGFELVQAL